MKFTESQIDELEQTGVVLIESPLEGVIYSGGMYRHGRHSWSERTICAPLPVPLGAGSVEGANLVSVQVIAVGGSWIRRETWQKEGVMTEMPAAPKKPCCEKCKKGGKTAALPATPAIAKLTAHKTSRRNHVTE